MSDAEAVIAYGEGLRPRRRRRAPAAPRLAPWPAWTTVRL